MGDKRQQAFPEHTGAYRHASKYVGWADYRPQTLSVWATHTADLAHPRLAPWSLL